MIRTRTSKLWVIISSRSVRTVLGGGISILCLYLAFRQIAYAELWASLGHAVYGYIVLALASVVVNTLAKGIRWKVLLGESGRYTRLSRILAALLVGQMLNTFLPVRVGEVSRVYLVGTVAQGRLFVAGTIVLEKLLDLLAYGIIFALLLLLSPLPDWLGSRVPTVLLTTLVVCIVLVVAIVQRERIGRSIERLIAWLPLTLQRLATSATTSLLSSLTIVQRRADLTRLVFWTALIWGSAVLNNHLILLALHIQLPLLASLLLLVVLQAGISFSTVPGWIGIFEYLCVLVLAIFGVSHSVALSYAVLLHSVILLPPTLAGLLFALLMRADQANSAPPGSPTPDEELCY